MHSTCTVNLVFQKIRLLNPPAKSLEEISNIAKINFVHLSLNKKSAKKSQADFDGYIKAINFTIHFRCSFYHKLLNYINIIN